MLYGALEAGGTKMVLGVFDDGSPKRTVSAWPRAALRSWARGPSGWRRSPARSLT